MKKSLIINYKEYQSYNELETSKIQLIDKAYLTAQNAYSPYSNFKVGTIVLLDNGELIAGNNQENVAYPSGLCAERVALFYVGATFPKNKIKSIIVVGIGELIHPETVITPCGACRQVMIEYELKQKSPIQVILVAKNEKTIVFDSVQEILPFYFGTVQK